MTGSDRASRWPLVWSLLLLCAAVLAPLLLLALLSQQQSRLLVVEETQRQLEQANQQTAWLLRSRMAEVEQDLLLLKAQLEQHGQLASGIESALASRISAAALVTSSDLIPLWGAPTAVAAVATQLQAEPDSHRNQLLALPAGAVPRLFLVRALQAIRPAAPSSLPMADSAAALLIVQLNPYYLWPFAPAAPGNSRCLIILESAPALCDSPQTSPHAQALIAHRQAAQGRLSWSSQQQSWLLSSLRLQWDASYGSADWELVAGEDLQAAAGGLRSQYFNLLPAALLALVCLLLAGNLFWRYGWQLCHQLILGLRRVAGADFDHVLALGPYVPLQRLSQSFNNMSARLQRRFFSFKALADLDRLILSGKGINHVAQHVLSGLRDMLPYRQACLVICNNKILDFPLAFVAYQRGAPITRTRIALERRDVVLLESQTEGLFLSGLHQVAFLREIFGADQLAYYALPIYSHHLLAGILIIGVTDQDEIAGELRFQINAFGNRVAVALAALARKQQLIDQVNTDSLTQIPNRRLLKAHADRAVQEARLRGYQGALLFIDLDRFKNVNDAHGHMMGDKVLAEAARRLSACKTPEQLVARFGGDEFAVLMPHISNLDEVTELADRMIRTLSQPYRHQNKLCHLGASVGIALFPQDASEFEALLVNADTAMSHAKRAGKDQYVFYRPEMGAERQLRAALENEIRLALAGNRFEMHYQPKVTAAGHNLTSFEALLRWQHERFSNLSPARLVAVAEESTLIHELGFWVLRSVCAQIKTWQQQLGKAVRVAVNISPKQLLDEAFVDQLVTLIEAADIQYRQLEIEVTESLFVQDLEKAALILKRISDLGISIAVDDFGTGFSSLSYLVNLPIDTLKIDRSFVSALSHTTKGDNMVRGIISLAHNLDLRVVAEGVETQVQAQRLSDMGCDELQGFYFSRAVPARAAEAFITGRDLVKTEEPASRFKLIK